MAYGILSALALPLETIMLPLIAQDLFQGPQYNKMLGIIVSPAPRSAPDATIEAAYIGSAKTSIRSTFVPSACTAGSGESDSIMSGARKYIRIPVTVITPIPVHAVILEK